MGAKEYKLFSIIKPNRLFDNIPESDLSFKISQKDFVNFEEGDIIFQSGDQADIIYLIVEGRVKIKHNANVDGQRYFEKSELEFFGEREFIQGGARTSSAVAETAVKAFILSKDVVNQLIEKNSALLHNLQAIDPMKDVARFGMTTQFHSDEFDALMRSVRQSAGGGDPYSTTESMGIMPDMPSASTIELPDDEARQDETVQISGQPEDTMDHYNPQFTMEILDPSEGSSYTVTDNTFATNDDFSFPENDFNSHDTFTINPDLFKTGAESSFVFPGNKNPGSTEEKPEAFDFELLHNIPEDELPLPENNIYNDIYGDQPLSSDGPSGSADFDLHFDLSAIPDDDGIKKEGSLDEYLAEFPEEADKIAGAENKTSELDEVQQLFEQEGFKLPEGFAQSLLDSDLLSKTPEELEQIIRSGGQIPPLPDAQTSTEEPTSEFTWDVLSPDAASQETVEETAAPLQDFSFNMDGFVFDEEQPAPASQAEDSDTALHPDQGRSPAFEEDQNTLTDEPPFHLSLPLSQKENSEFSDIVSGENSFIPPDEQRGDIYNAEPPFHLSLPDDASPEDTSFNDTLTGLEDTSSQTSEEQEGGKDDIYNTQPPFHLSLPGDDEENRNETVDTRLSKSESPADTAENHDFFHSDDNEDPFAPFQVKITGEQTAPETADAAPQDNSTTPHTEQDFRTEEESITKENEQEDWGGWNFDENDAPDYGTEKSGETEGDISFNTTPESSDSFEFFEPQRDEAPLPEITDETPKPERGSLLNTLFGKSFPEKEKHDEQEPLPEDEQSGEYIWDFEKNEFVKLQPGKIDEAIPEINSDEPGQDFTKTLADEPMPPQRDAALTGEFVTSEFIWDPVNEEFVSVTDLGDSAEPSGTEDQEDTDTAQPQGDIYDFTSPVTTGEVVSSDFVWDAEKEEFIAASELETVTPETGLSSETEAGEETPFSFESFGAQQPETESTETTSGNDDASDGFASAEEEDIYTLPRDFASGDFNFGGDTAFPKFDDEQNSTIPEDSEEPAEEEPETEGNLWDLSDEEEPPHQTATPPADQNNERSGPELKLPTLNFLDDAPLSGDISPEGQLPSDAMDQVKNWIDKASDHDLMNLLSNMGRAFETIERQPEEQQPASPFDALAESTNIYNTNEFENEGIVRDDMENTSNQENKKSLRSLFKVASPKPQPPASSEPENVFDAGDAFWGNPDDTSERESFLQEDSRDQNDLSDLSGQPGSEELGNFFNTSDTPAAFVKREEPNIQTPLKKTGAFDSVQMSSDREAGLSVEQLRMIIEAAKTVNSNVKLDEALTTIVVTASNLTKADRGTLYIIDRETDELWSKVMKGEQIEEIRLKIGQGISGWVARSGEILNLKNAYEDPRFDASFDSITGYKTTSMLCYPIKDKHNNVIAVLQLLNSRQGNFTKLDEEMISALSSFIGITIQNAELIEGMVQGDRLNSLGKVANFIISDIKKPILTIKHLAEHLRTKKDLPRDVRSVLKMILDQSIIVGDLILTTLNYSQGKVILNKKLVKINAVLDEILGMLQDSVEYKKVQIFKKYDRDVFVMVDRKELYQAFFQITKNACDAMPGGGKLQVTTKVIDEDGTLEISFKDSGMGIPEAVKEKLFEPFFSQGKKNGIGLGLPITEKIIREHGGTITVESQLGDGANFIITIPQVTKVGA